METKHRAVLIEKTIPQFIRVDYPRFVEFITAYYSYQDEVGQPYEFIANLLNYNNVDLTSLALLDKFANTYLNKFPTNIDENINKSILIKNIKQFYQSAGNEESIKLLFRLLFNETVEMYYPTNDIIRVSDGRWKDTFALKVFNDIDDETIIGLIGTEIEGQTSGAIGIVEDVQLNTSSDDIEYAEIFIKEVSPIYSYLTFEVGETVTGTTLDGLNEISTIVTNVLTDISITTNDLYNTPGDAIEVVINGDTPLGHGHDCVVSVKNVTAGSIDSMTIIHGGEDYAVDDTITFVSSTGRGAKAKVTTIGTLDTITAIEMVHEGYGFEALPSYEIETVAGTGAILYPVSTTIGKITLLEFNNFGISYDEVAGHDVIFIKRMHVYRDEASTDTTLLKINENIEGSISGATGIIKRYDSATGMVGYVLDDEAINFEADDEITASGSGALDFFVNEIFENAGVIVPGAVADYDGYFDDTRGFISSDKYLQDSYYYQDFSYVISTLQDRANWIGPLKDLIHPAGMIVFGFADESGVVSSYSSGGIISPLLSTIEFYKFGWDHFVDYDTILTYGNTTLSVFSDYFIYELAGVPDELSDYEYKKTNICFGSDIYYEFADSGQDLLIDDTWDLLLDDTYTLLI